MRRVKILLLALVLPLLVLGGAGAYYASKMRGKEAPKRTAAVARGDVVVAVRETGVVEPVKRVEVKSKVAGRLAQLAVDEGDRVARGQFIARLEAPEVEAQRDQARPRLHQARLTLQQNPALISSQITQVQASLRAAEASLKEAEARRKDAQRIHENKRQLFEMGGYVPRNDVDSAQSAIDVARQQEASAMERVGEQKAALAAARARQAEVAMSRARVSEAEAGVQQIQDSLAEIDSRLSDAIIRAPCAGVIISRQVREGEVITAVSYYGSGAPLVTIGDVSSMLVTVNLNEVDIDKVRLGQAVQIKADALTGKTFRGIVTRISPASWASANPSAAGGAGSGGSGTQNIVRFPVEITVSGSLGALKPGMTANVEIVSKRAMRVLWVPNDSIFQKRGKPSVTVVGPQKDARGRLKSVDRRVTVGLVNDMRSEVRSGVKLGEKVELGKSGIPERKKINIQSGPQGGD